MALAGSFGTLLHKTLRDFQLSKWNRSLLVVVFFFLLFPTKLSETAIGRVGRNPTSFSWTSRPSTTELNEAVEQKVQLDQ